MKNFAFLIVTSLVFLGCGDPPATGDGKDNATKAVPGNETEKPESGSTDGGN